MERESKLYAAGQVFAFVSTLGVYAFRAEISDLIDKAGWRVREAYRHARKWRPRWWYLRQLRQEEALEANARNEVKESHRQRQFYAERAASMDMKAWKHGVNAARLRVKCRIAGPQS